MSTYNPIWALKAFRDRLVAEAEAPVNAFTEAALERHKREGMELAVRGRLIAMAIITAMLPLLYFNIQQIWYLLFIIGFVVIGLVQRRVARVGQSRVEVLLIAADLALMTALCIAPNPLADGDRPLAMAYHDSPFAYFFVLLALGTLAYSWRTIWGIGMLTTLFWLLGLLALWLLSTPDPALTGRLLAAFEGDETLTYLLDPNNFLGFVRTQEVVVMLIVAAILAVTVRRNHMLLIGQAALERERANLSRYFSPNVVNELSSNDEPLKRIKTQDVAVLFVDIVDFTSYASGRAPEAVIRTLREFHGRMEREVFAHDGTLDKYLGDGLMATFGTPMAGKADALNALRCARAMMESMAAWNLERVKGDEPPLKAAFGLHYGPAVLGDIGGENRLEYAVIGDTVNVASRIEHLTRSLSTTLAASEALVAEARSKSNADEPALSGLASVGGQSIRGVTEKLSLWTLN